MTGPALEPAPPRTLLDRLRGDGLVDVVELRPPRTGMGADDRLDAWIDHDDATRRLLGSGLPLFYTDDAVGVGEEENLRHLASVIESPDRLADVVPFLTCKHSLEYCLLYAERAASQGFRALAVLGGDRSGGPPRCVPHAYQLRQRIRTAVPALTLGGWVNPHGDVERQLGYLLDPDVTADFYLTQVVSHHHLDRVEAFLEGAERAGLRIPGVWGVFYYRSANPNTLDRLDEFLPVPRSELTEEFGAGGTAEEICARTVRGLRALGITNIYLSNFGISRPERLYRRVMERL